MKKVQITDANVIETIRSIMPAATTEKNGLMDSKGFIIQGSFLDLDADGLPNGALRVQVSDGKDYGDFHLPFRYNSIATVITQIVGFQLSSSQDGRMAFRTKWDNWSEWKIIQSV